MQTFLSLAFLVLVVALKAEGTPAPSSAPSAATTSFCGFPIDILLIPDPFAEPLEICNELVDTEASCEASLFYTSYQCFWDDGLCTSNADLTGEDSTCPPILDQQTCEDTNWIGPRICVWYEPALPSSSPSSVPSIFPTTIPSDVPSSVPSTGPTSLPSAQPSSTPSKGPTTEPSTHPSSNPSMVPTIEPSTQPSQAPSSTLTSKPSVNPSLDPTLDITNAPSKTPTREPSSSPSNTPSSNPSVGPTVTQSSSPSGLPSRSPSDSPTQVPTQNPSQTPSMVPTKIEVNSEVTAHPSLSPSQRPSSFPSTSSIPSSQPSKDKFSWDIEPRGDPIVAFDDASDQEEIMIDYNISLQENTVVVYQEDCLTAVPFSEIEVHKTLSPTSSSHGILAVDLDIMQGAIMESAVWTDGDVGVGYIDICIRVDLMLIDGTDPPESVNFHETKLALTIDLTRNFEVTLDLNRTEANTTAQEVSADYSMVACQCDENENCINKIVTPGSMVILCLESTSPGVMFVGIQSMDLTQNSLKWHPITDGVGDDLTALTLQGEKCVVRTLMASVFFQDESPPNVIVEGVAMLEFTNTTDGGVRRLHSKIVNRGMEETEEEGASTFSVDLGLASAESPSSAASKRLVSLATLLVVSFFLLF